MLKGTEQSRYNRKKLEKLGWANKSLTPNQQAALIIWYDAYYFNNDYHPDRGIIELAVETIKTVIKE